MTSARKRLLREAMRAYQDFRDYRENKMHDNHLLNNECVRLEYFRRWNRLRRSLLRLGIREITVDGVFGSVPGVAREFRITCYRWDDYFGMVRAFKSRQVTPKHECFRHLEVRFSSAVPVVTTAMAILRRRDGVVFYRDELFIREDQKIQNYLRVGGAWREVLELYAES